MKENLKLYEDENKNNLLIGLYQKFVDKANRNK